MKLHIIIIQQAIIVVLAIPTTHHQSSEQFIIIIVDEITNYNKNVVYVVVNVVFCTSCDIRPPPRKQKTKKNYFPHYDDTRTEHTYQVSHTYIHAERVERV